MNCIQNFPQRSWLGKPAVPDGKTLVYYAPIEAEREYRGQELSDCRGTMHNWKAARYHSGGTLARHQEEKKT